MPLSHVDFNALSETDLQRLIDNGVPEGPRIEYKRDFVGLRDDDKKEFLKDISAFANASGGYILYGVAEKDGIPIPPLLGLSSTESSSGIARLENIVRDSLEPRIVGLTMRPVPLRNGNSVVAVRVPRSWNPPHRVSFQKWNKFFTRNSNACLSG